MSANSMYNHRGLQSSGRSGAGGGGGGASGSGGGGGAPTGPGGNGAGVPPPGSVVLSNAAPPQAIALGGSGGGGPGGGGPPGLPPGPGAALAYPGAMRINDSFEAIKAEFEALMNEVELCKSQKDEVEVKLGAQMSELTAIRNALFDLERQHSKIRSGYEDEIARLKSELTAFHNSRNPPAPPPGLAGLGVSSGVSGPGTPGYRPGQHPQDGPGGPLPPPPGPPPGYENGVSRGGSDMPPSLDGRRVPKDGPRDRQERDRDRDREREYELRDREMREREMLMRDRDRDRDRDMMAVDRGRGRGDFEMDSRERELRERERELDRLADGRDPKRPKKDNGAQGYGGPGSHTTTPRLPPSHALYGAGSSGGPSSNGPTGSPYTSAPPPLSHPSNGGPPPPPGSAGGPLTKTEGGSGVLGLGPPPSATGGPGQAPASSAAGALVPVGEEFNYNNVPLEYRKDGPDWFAAFNPKIKKSLDIQLVHSFQHTSVVCCVQFSQDGRFLATGCNQTAQIFDTKSGLKVCDLPHESEAHTGDLYIRSVRFSPDGKLLATGAEDRQIRIWDIARKRIRQVFDGHQQEIYSLDFSQDGRLIVSGSGDRTTRIWDMNDATNCKVFTITDVIDHNTDAGVTSVAISPSACLVAAGSLDNVIRIWDVSTGLLLERLRGHTNSVYSVAFTPDGKGLVTGSLDKTLKLWDVSHLNSVEGRRKAADNPDQRDRVERERMERMEREGKVVQSANCLMDFIGHKDYVLSVSMSSDSRWVVSGSKDRCVHVWDSNTATLQLMLQGHKNSVISLDLNSSNDLLATGSGDSFARIWSLARI